MPNKISNFKYPRFKLEIGNSNKGFTLIEILVSISIMAVVGFLFFPNIKRFSTNQQFQNEISDVKNNLKKAQSMYTTGTRCTANKSVLSWSLVLNRSSGLSYNLKANCINPPTISTETTPATVLNSSSLQTTCTGGNTCSSGNTAVELKFDKTGFSYSCDGGTTFTAANFCMNFQNTKNTSQSTTILVNTIGTISQN